MTEAEQNRILDTVPCPQCGAMKGYLAMETPSSRRRVCVACDACNARTILYGWGESPCPTQAEAEELALDDWAKGFVYTAEEFE